MKFFLYGGIKIALVLSRNQDDPFNQKTRQFWRELHPFYLYQTSGPCFPFREEHKEPE